MVHAQLSRFGTLLTPFCVLHNKICRKYTKQYCWRLLGFGCEFLKIQELDDDSGLTSMLLSALKASSSARDLENGRVIHADAVQTRKESDIYVANTLINMYGKCGSMSDALRVFNTIRFPTAVSWNVLMHGYTENGEEEMALELFRVMLGRNFRADPATYVAALKACTSFAGKESGIQVDGKLTKVRSLEKAMVIHFQASKDSFMDIFVGNSLVDTYGKCGSLLDARAVFDRMPGHDVVTWTALLLGYVENGEEKLALDLFWDMQREGCAANALSFVAALKACTSLAVKGSKSRSLDVGVRIHSQAERCGFESDMVFSNALVDMYSKCGSMVHARRAFDRMSQHNVISWSSLMLGYAENDEEDLALELLADMQREGCAPNSFTFVSALKACTNLALKETGQQIDGKLVKVRSLEKGILVHSQAASFSFEFDGLVGNTLVDMYAKCGSLENAQMVFSRMPRRDAVSWNAMMLSYVVNCQGELALELFAQMTREGVKPSNLSYVAALKACTCLATKEEGTGIQGKLVKLRSLEKGMIIHSETAAAHGYDSEALVANTLVDMYAKCGSMLDARKTFDKMRHHSVVPWTSLMLGYAENGEGELALELFSSMRLIGFNADAQTFAAVFKVAGTLAELHTCKVIHADVIKQGLEADGVLTQSLVDVYGKCGNVISAQQVFDSFSNADFKIWTALVAGYSRQGKAKEVFQLFGGMREEGFHADGVTFLCILACCSHAGLVEKGKGFFGAMSSKYGINPSTEHYCCMVDILGRANQLEDAVMLVNSMPYEPSALIWRTVLAACCKWKNAVLGRLAFESLLKLDDEGKDVGYTLMANLYGSLGMWEEQAKVETMRVGAKLQR